MTMTPRRNGAHIWKYERLSIEPSGGYVKLIAPCGESRRVTTQTARKIAEDLMAAVDLIEEAQAVMARCQPALDKLGDETALQALEAG